MGDRSPTTRGRDDFPNAGFKNSKTYAVENIVLFSAIKTELTRQENSVKLPQSARNTGEQELGNKEGQNKGGHSALFGEDNGGHISLFTPKSAMSPFLEAYRTRTASAGGWDTHCKRGSFLSGRG
jgi:hypothetical protein